MNNSPVQKLEALGQSIWIDFIRRGMIQSGELKKRIDEDGVSGITSNPTIFEKAITESNDYDDAIRALVSEGKNAVEIYEALTVEDIQMAADALRPVFNRQNGADGFVSLEVSPHLVHDTRRTIEEARRLWQAVDRPNVMIKVPGTAEGLPAIQRLISEGINVNITLLFGLPRYRAVSDAYLSGLESRVSQAQPVNNIASVASFFLSRIDVLLDPQLERFVQSSDPHKAQLAQTLVGQAAIASARAAYEILEETMHSPRFRALEQRGARPQRLLWASTSTKNPSYSDVKYVEPLIGPQTINTMTIETLDAYRDHGDPVLSLEKGRPEAHRVLNSLAELGIDIDAVTQQLEDEGAVKFQKSYDLLMQKLAESLAHKV